MLDAEVRDAASCLAASGAADGDVAALARLLDDWHRALPVLNEPAVAGSYVGGLPYEREHWVGRPPQRLLLCCCPNRVVGRRDEAHVVIRDARRRAVGFKDPPAAPFASSWEDVYQSHRVACRWFAEHDRGIALREAV